MINFTRLPDDHPRSEARLKSDGRVTYALDDWFITIRPDGSLLVRHNHVALDLRLHTASTVELRPRSVRTEKTL